MSSRSDRIKENMQMLSDETLVKIIETDFRDYDEEAITCAKQELATRGKLGAVITSEPRAPESTLQQPAKQEIPASPTQNKKKARFWGGVFLIVAAVIIYAAVLGVATIIVGKEHGMRMASDAPFRIIFYVAITALCLWGGIKRRPRWASFLGITLAIIGIVAFSARFTLARGAGVSLAGEVVGKASFIAGIILIAAGALCFLWALTGRKSMS